MFFHPNVHRFFFLFGIITMGFGVMLGAVPTSVPQFILLINWLLEAGFSQKWKMLKQNRIFWAIELLFFIHVFGMFYTEDLAAGFKDLQIKLPLCILPIVLFSSKPLNEKENLFVLLAFLLGCLVNTTWCLLYSFVLHTDEQIRNISRFMSHIRLGLYLNMAVAVCYYLYSVFSKSIHKAFFLGLGFYFFSVMCVLGLASGLVILALLLIAASIYSLLKLKWSVKLATVMILLISFYLVYLT